MYVKRDELTHPEVMGNKWRKLKYNLEAAQNQGKKQLITMGGAFSNHIAATASAAKEFGFDAVGIIRGEELNEDSNATLQKAVADGMKLIFVSRTDYKGYRQDPGLLEEQFPNSYFLPEGGTNHLAIQGCEEIIDEITTEFDLIACPIGTGGTFCGLVKSANANQQVLGFSALKGYFIHEEVQLMLEKYGITNQNHEIYTNYHFGGYGKTTKELIEFMNWFEENFQIPLDPIYTGKCFSGVWDMVKRNKFEKNLRIVLLHTGGLQGIQGFLRKNQNIIQ